MNDTFCSLHPLLTLYC